MMTRRSFMQSLTLLSAGMLASPAKAVSITDRVWFMPDESEPHERTWMAFGASKRIWGSRLLPEVRRNLVAIAQTIAEYEPVSMLVTEKDYALAKKMLASSAVELIVSPLDDLWMRDTGPVFVITEQGDKAAVDFNFNGWGNKQAFARDAKVAKRVAKSAGVKVFDSFLVLEGGGIEVDGHGTAIITESCVLNPNRNPEVSKQACEAELKALLGLEKIIWLPGVKGKDITDGHTDFYARFAAPSVVVAGYEPDPAFFDHEVSKRHIELLKNATDAAGRKLAVEVISGPGYVREKYESDEFAAGYINYYVCNGAVILPEFGDKKADGLAKEKLQSLFSKHDIVQLDIDGIAAGGGGIHCTTQQEPLV